MKTGRKPKIVTIADKAGKRMSLPTLQAVAYVRGISGICYSEARKRIAEAPLSPKALYADKVKRAGRKVKPITFAMPDGTLKKATVPEAIELVCRESGVTASTARTRLSQTPHSAERLYAKKLTPHEVGIVNTRLLQRGGIKVADRNGTQRIGRPYALARKVAAETGLSTRGAYNRITRFSDDPKKLYAPKDSTRIGRPRKPKLTDLCADLDARKKALRGD